jgi:hypothetical protein
MKSANDTAILQIANIIHHVPLARALCESIRVALDAPDAVRLGARSVWEVFDESLKTAIRDIEDHPRGQLFRRLIEYGPLNPDAPQSVSTTGQTTLSDFECGQCVEFIFSHMINRFKGELAELLAIQPCLELVHRLQGESILPSHIKLYMGDMVGERRQLNAGSDEANVQWGDFTKGADGLMVVQGENCPEGPLTVCGVIEVKSMRVSNRRLIAQLHHHIARLEGGVRLGAHSWESDIIMIDNPVQVMVIPSSWKLNRDRQMLPTETGHTLVLPDPTESPLANQTERVGLRTYQIKLAWSQEALNQAAYEMTFWYMSQVGEHIYNAKGVPSEWGDMTPAEAGYNAIKMMLYYMPLRHLPKRKELLAIKLYNVYSFGYPAGVDAKDMLWPEDFLH